MARLSGIELNDKHRVIYALTQIKGVGMSLATKIMKSLSMSEGKRVKDLDPEELNQIAKMLEGYKIEGELLRSVRSDISRLQQTGSYRGIRHSRNLPSRGQRTRHNARGKRGKRKTVGAFKKDMLSKMKQGSKE